MPPAPTAAELEEFDRFTASHAEPEALFERVRDSFGEYVTTRSCGPEIARRIQHYASRGEAASLVRLGDGEGNLMALRLADYPALATHGAREIALMHFGASDVLVTAGSGLRSEFHHALRNADLIGFPGRWTLRFLLAMREQRLDLRAIYGIAAVYAYLEQFSENLGLGSKVGSSSAFHQALLPHYEELIAGRDIGLVSCHHELPNGLSRRMGARSVVFYPVPRQAKIVDGAPSDTGHYPGRYRALREELANARPGIVYFVAAGMLGKVYCDAIRAAGGIAVDIGATADIWAGVRSRYWGQTKETFETWRIL